MRRARADGQAVLYCKTIMSQGLWFGEGYNNVHGRVLNPNNVCSLLRRDRVSQLTVSET